MTTSCSSLSIIIPVYNEEELLESQLNKLLENLKKASFDSEVIVVNDGSTDNSAAILLKFPAITVITHEKNRGLGAALRSGFAKANMEYSVFSAIDLDFENQVAADFIPMLGKADVLVGVRLKRNGYNILMKFNSLLFIKLCNIFLKLPFRDVNWTSIYRTSLLKQIEIKYDGIVSLVEIIYRLKLLNATFVEVETIQPLRKTERKATASRFPVMVKTLSDLIIFLIKKD